MEPILLDGKTTAACFQEKLREKARAFEEKTGTKPHLAAILVGNSGPSETYVAAKMETCKKVGFQSSLIRFDADISEGDLLSEIERLNQDPDLHGFIVQLPLPRHIGVDAVINQIDPRKDVDGFHPENLGKMAKGQGGFASATPWGIVMLMEHYQLETEGRHVVVLGRSQIVGMPMMLLMSRAGYPGNATVTICHSKTRNLPEITRQADILVAALGVPEFVKAEMVKPGAVVIDVGLSRIPDDTKKTGFRLVGDVDFPEVAPLCSAITPVPGGVGPMTITALMQNTLKAAFLQNGLPWEGA
jgi:methylenetetrahydrofolate dehydrogenase (NADP+) / methenyltetrahydrofolate cyclohydrolase